jgi:hypothetical protein
MSYVTRNTANKTNFAALNDALILDVSQLNTVRFEFSGTYAFTSVFEATSDGTNWFPFQVAMVNAATVVTSHSTANATQAYEASCNSVTSVRIRVSAFTSAGAHKVLIAGTDAAIEPAPVLSFPASQAVSTPSGTPYNLVTTASNNLNNIKNTAGNLFELTVSNPTATAAYVKLYNKASAPVVASDVPVMTIAIPATAAGVGEKVFNFGAIGKRFATGIAIAVVGAAVATDSTNAVAGVQINATYI